MMRVERYAGDGANAVMFQLGSNQAKLFYSYETLIGVYHSGWMWVLRNRWGPTTARHIREACERVKNSAVHVQYDLTDRELEAHAANAMEDAMEKLRKGGAV